MVLMPVKSIYKVVAPPEYRSTFATEGTQNGVIYSINLYDGCPGDWFVVGFNDGMDQLTIKVPGSYTVTVVALEWNYNCQWTSMGNSLLLTKSGKQSRTQNWQQNFGGGGGWCNNNDFEIKAFQYTDTFSQGDTISYEVQYQGGGAHSAALLSTGVIALAPNF